MDKILIYLFDDLMLKLLHKTYFSVQLNIYFS